MKAFEEVAARAKAKAQRTQAKQKAQALSYELNMVVRRLEARVLEEKRQHVYADGQRALASMPIEEFKARKQVCNLSDVTHASLLTKYMASPMTKAQRAGRAKRQQWQYRCCPQGSQAHALAVARRAACVGLRAGRSS